MFNYHDSILILFYIVQNLHQTPTVARMQPNTGLVEDVKRVDQRGANGSGQVDALHLAARQRARLAIQGQIGQPNIHQVLVAATNLAQN